MTAVLQTLEAARQSLVLLRRHRLVWLLAAGAVGITLLSLAMPERVVRSFVGDELFGVPVYLLVFQFGLPTVLSYLGLWIVHDEITDRSVVHVFAQPVHRASLLIGKWAAVTLFGALAAALVCAAYWVALALPAHPWRRGLAPEAATLWAFVICAAAAAPGYAAVGMLCGVATKRPLIAAILFVVGWEVSVSNLPPQARVRGWTVADPVRRLLVDLLDPPAESNLSELLQHSLAGQDTSQLADPVWSIVWFSGLVLGVAILIYVRREYDARARD